MILTLKITLLSGFYARANWEGVIEIESASSLYDLHSAIQNTLDFDNDHMYGFFISRTTRSRARVTLDDGSEDTYGSGIGNLFPLPRGKNLYYLFDYGDSWLFKIARATRANHEIDPHITYPRLISETGERPVQYPVEDE
jgi:hypothetical protein